MKPPLVLGLAGKYCAGKSTIASWLVSLGAWEIDVDKLGHAAREECREALLARFGETALDRRALGALVFADPLALADLEAIVHPVMNRMVNDLIMARRVELQTGAATTAINHLAEELAGPFCNIIIVNAALLFRNGFNQVCDLCLWIEAPAIIRLWRGLIRDQRGLRATLALMRSQNGLGPQPSQKNADIYRVRNLGGQFVQARIRVILERFYGKE